MTTLFYTITGVTHMKIQFFNVYDATDAAVALLDCPGVINIYIQEDGYKPYPISRKCRYVVNATKDSQGHRWTSASFASITDAARFGENNFDYQILDMFENKIYRSEDVSCLVG